MGKENQNPNTGENINIKREMDTNTCHIYISDEDIPLAHYIKPKYICLKDSVSITSKENHINVDTEKKTLNIRKIFCSIQGFQKLYFFDGQTFQKMPKKCIANVIT